MSIDTAKLSLPKKFQTFKNFILDKASSIAEAIKNNPKTSAVLITQTALIALLSRWGFSESSKNNDLNTRIDNLQWSYDNSTKENDQLKKDKKSQEITISNSNVVIDSQKDQIQNLKDSIKGYEDQLRDLTHHSDIWYSSIDDLEKKYQEL
jgi:chromosome segregation ATPase